MAKLTTKGKKGTRNTSGGEKGEGKKNKKQNKNNTKHTKQETYTHKISQPKKKIGGGWGKEKEI